MEEIRKYHPSEVVLLFYYNDLQFNIDRLGNRELLEAPVRGKGRSCRADPARTGTAGREGTRGSGREEAGGPRPSMVPRCGPSQPPRRSGQPLDWSRDLSAYGLAPAVQGTARRGPALRAGGRA